MARPAWLVDGTRIATKIKSASEIDDPKTIKWKSNPTRACPNCKHVIDNSDVTQDWPGLPRGVKFDPSDQALLWHLFAKVGVGNAKPHPFIDEFIPTVDKEDGICYTHPEKLPGVKQDGSAAHFFHRTIKAYNTGSRKRRKIQSDDQCNGDIRWHKTGKTKPVFMDGIHKGCKKIMVLYMSMAKGEKAEKTNWVMHQIHIGSEEDDKDGDFVVSKVFYQQQAKPREKNEQDFQDNLGPTLSKPDPHTPTASVPDPPRSKEHSNLESREEAKSDTHESSAEVLDPENKENDANAQFECEKPNDHGNDMIGDLKWSQGEFQFFLDSQQLADGMYLCDELLQSQPCGGDEEKKVKPCLSDYASFGAEHLKKDLEECQNLSQFDLSNAELDTPPDLRLSQLDLQLGSQESLFSWAGNKAD